jgi:hypothetical protein
VPPQAARPARERYVSDAFVGSVAPGKSDRPRGQRLRASLRADARAEADALDFP